MPTAPPGLIVRAASAADIAGLCELANDPGYRWGTLRLPFQSIEQTRAWLTGVGPDDHLLVADLDGIIAGNAGLHRQRGRRSHVAVLGMGVRDAHRGRGVGSALLAALLDLADNWIGLARLELTVFVDNDAAVALYERHGFAREGTMRAYALRDGVHVDAWMMARLRSR